jgi:hypothetical protein
MPKNPALAKMLGLLDPREGAKYVIEFLQDRHMAISDPRR